MIADVLCLVAFFATVAGLIWAILRMNRRSRFTYLTIEPMPLGPIPIGPYVRSGGRTLQVTSADAWAAEELQKIALLWRESRDADPSRRKPVLLPARPMLREIERADAAAGLICCVRVHFPELNRLAIWLLGRSGGTLGTTAVVGFYRHSDVRMRRDVARALTRMRAWRELQHMAAVDSDPQVRRLAATPKKKTFADRYAAFAATGVTPARQSESPAPMPLVWNVAPDAGRLPKPAWWIRQVLERIHRLLRGEARSQ